VPVPGVDQPIILSGDVPVTFWQHVDASGGAVAVVDLGRLLKHLHRMPASPFTLPQFRPVDRLTTTAAGSPWLSAADQRWLLAQATILQQQGLVHGDAQLDNVIPAVPGPVLADWDGAAAAPRERDLVPAAAEQRFGGSAQLLADLLDAYGADPTGDPGWPVLISMYELRSITAHIRRAPPFARQAALRIASLRAGDRSVRWSAVS
jgi:aminoglycoside phosphotransferase (APT) family kinase protein